MEVYWSRKKMFWSTGTVPTFLSINYQDPPHTTGNRTMEMGVVMTGLYLLRLFFHLYTRTYRRLWFRREKEFDPFSYFT